MKSQTQEAETHQEEFVIRQAEYIGSFVVSGSTHDERILAVRQQLARMRVVLHSQPVSLGVCISGIKVFDESGKFVYMAHALRRISYATCCPEFCQIAFLAREPQHHSSLQYCHAFITHSVSEAEDINNIVGDAFKLAYAKQQAVSPLPTFRQFVENQSRLRQQQRMQMHEADLKMQRSCSSNLPQIFCQPRHSSSSSSHVSSNVSRITPHDVPFHMQRTTCSNDSGSNSGIGSHSPYLNPVSPLADSSRSSCVLSEDDSGVGTGRTHSAIKAEPSSLHGSMSPVPPSSNSNTSSSPMKVFDSQNASQSITSSSSSTGADTSRISSPALQCYSQGVIRSNNRTPSDVLFHPQQMRANLQSTPSHSETPPPNKSMGVSNATNESWYQPQMPRDEVLDFLNTAEIGSFLIRDSITHPGAYALSVRVPSASNISHFLVQRTSKGGVRIKGLEKEWPTLDSMVIHLSVMPEMLPCPLRLPQSTGNDRGFAQVIARKSHSSSEGKSRSDSPADDITAEEDEDYQKLCDFSRLMSRLKASQSSTTNS